jgi:prepilin-type N-terminal cleavage/methylation domain-containing protein
MESRARLARRGFTLIEIVVAVSLTLAVFAITLPFVRAQTRSLGSTASRLDAEQIARYAQRAIDKELRLAIAEDGQSMIVMAGTMAISFNANLLARDTSDANALEIDEDADSSVTEAWRVANASTLPLSTELYPTEDYTSASGAASGIETISYFLHADTVSDRSDIYVLWRRVNAGDSTLIVRGIHVPADSAFFSYQTMSGGSLTTIASSSLPLYWDTTAVDDIRAVTIRSAGFYRNARENEDIIRTVYWTTFLGNATSTVTGCGDAPAAPTAVAQSKQTGSAGYHVRVTWTNSTDDGADDDDVTH